MKLRHIVALATAVLLAAGLAGCDTGTTSTSAAGRGDVSGGSDLSATGDHTTTEADAKQIPHRITKSVMLILPGKSGTCIVQAGGTLVHMTGDEAGEAKHPGTTYVSYAAPSAISIKPPVATKTHQAQSKLAGPPCPSGYAGFAKRSDFNSFPPAESDA